MTAAQAEIGKRLTISEREWDIVSEILTKHLAGRTVWAFGSRATGRRVKQFSDLDLAVSGQLTWAKRAALSEAFDDSLLNFKVDVVESSMVDADFWARIERDFVVLQTAS
jgi:predicted nucleotidyltransferase